MSADRLFDYETTLRSGGAANPEAHAQAMRNLLRDLTEKAEMDAAVADLKQSISAVSTRLGTLETKVDRLETKVDRLEGKVDMLESKTEALDAKIDMVELRLNGRIDLVEAKLTAEIRSLGMDLMKAMNNQVWKMVGTIGVLIALVYAIEKFV